MTRLAEIEARLKAATRGEWTAHRGADAIPFIRTAERKITMIGAADDDADFLSHCGGDSGDVTWLLTLVKTLAAGVQAAHTPDDGNCPVCLEDDGHADDCELGIALRAAEEAGV